MTLLRAFGLLPIAGALWYFKDPARRSKILQYDRKPCEAVNDPPSSAVAATQHASPGAALQENSREFAVSGSVFAPGSSARANWNDKYQERSRWQQFTIFSMTPPTPTSANEPPEEEQWHDRGCAPRFPNPPLEEMPLDQFIDDGIDRMFDDDSDIEVNEEVGGVEPREAEVEGRAEVAVAAPNVDPPIGEASSSTGDLATQHATSSRAGSLETVVGSPSQQPEPNPGPSSFSQMQGSEEDPEPETGVSVRPRRRPRPSSEGDQPA